MSDGWRSDALRVLSNFVGEQCYGKCGEQLLGASFNTHRSVRGTQWLSREVVPVRDQGGFVEEEGYLIQNLRGCAGSYFDYPMPRCIGTLP